MGIRFPLIALVSLIMLPSIQGCATVSYYAQAVKGHIDLITAARPVGALLNDEQQPHALRERLRFAQKTRDFASKEMGLPDNESYRTYVDIGRRYVVWNVVATKEFAVEPERWCFPILGCLSYRGYFSEAEARSHAERLRRAGYDAQIAGAQAYSTLGWFDDPLLSTFVSRGDADLVALLVHELAHQQLYVAGDTAFNEAFAVAVSQEGVRRWFTARNEPDAYQRYLEHQQRSESFRRLLLSTRQQLKQVYDDIRLTEEAKREQKRQLFAQMRQRYAQLREQWGGYAGYDHWMAQDLNNAHLALIATYHEFVPAFQLLLAKESGDMRRFYVKARELSALPKAGRRIQLQALLDESSGVNVAQSADSPEEADPDREVSLPAEEGATVAQTEG